jgi:type II secretory pathway component PulK
MKLSQSNIMSQYRRESASVLILVLWIVVGLVAISLYFSSSMTYELRASDNRVSGLDSDQAIEGAARYVAWVLNTYSTNGAVPNNTQFSCEAVPVGDSHFWLIGRDPAETSSSEPYFGLVDETGKLNLNTVTTNTLYWLPNMPEDFADAIIDWRSTNGYGLYSLNYDSLGYQDKNSPFETVDELRLVYGATMDLLAGNDLNHNGVLDDNEKNATGAKVEPGLLEYFTVYSREPNFLVYNGDNVLLTNVSGARQEDLDSLFNNSGVSTSYASRLAGNTYNGVLDFCAACKEDGMSSDDFAKIYPYVTTSTAGYIRGRVNINTADSTVLTALFVGVGSNLGVDENAAESAAQTMITYRKQNPQNLNSVAWIIDALGSTSPVIRVLRSGDFITTHSYQFTADIAAVGPYGRGYRRVKFIFDTSDGTAKILYRQDLSRLGWALGDKARQTWVASAKQ